MDSKTSPLDIELLNESADYGLDGLRELIDMYMQQADETISGLKKAIKDGRAETVMDLAHKLAGSSAICGLTAMIDPLRKMEKLGREKKLNDAEDVLAKIVENLDLTHRLLEEYLAEKSRHP